MKRADFLKQASVLTVRATLLPGVSLGYDKRKLYKIGIVGAGIAGLFLPDQLKKDGHAVTLLEAKDQAGGRIRENQGFYPSSIDLGVQWIHGKNELYKLVKRSKTPIYVDKNSDSIKVRYKGTILDDFPPELYQFMKEIRATTPLQQNVSVLSFARQFNNDPDFIELVEHLVPDTGTKADYFSLNEVAKMLKTLYLVDYQFTDTKVARP